MRAMAPFPERAGSAASLLGFVQLTFGAVIGAGVGVTLEVWRTAMPLAAVLAVLGGGMVMVERIERAQRPA
jgi:DHA1 family bicyclomycin/chloramphenicol resistance-like MFS transporter